MLLVRELIFQMQESVFLWNKPFPVWRIIWTWYITQGSEIKNNASHNTLFYDLHPLIVALRNKKRGMCSCL